jgi:hypothetical protein
MTSSTENIKTRLEAYINDWCLFAREYLKVNLDEEQEAVLRSVQINPMTACSSGTSRGKDYVAAVAAICFLYLTPRWNDKGDLVANTKVALTAPTGRQVKDIMMPEISRIWLNSAYLPGELTSSNIRMPLPYKEWFLTGFKADDHNTEAWTGFHAANVLFVVTEASGMHEKVFEAIEGNLQGNSRLLLVFNNNTNTGYAAHAMRSRRFAKFRLNSLNAINVKEKRIIIPGQVDYAWVKDKVENWCEPILEEKDFSEVDGDFRWEAGMYRPNDTFRVKILGLGPKTAEGQLIPLEWVEAANLRYAEFKKIEHTSIYKKKPLRLGVDVAGMGRDSSCFCPRYGNVVETMTMVNSGGTANHMAIAGKVISVMKANLDDFTGLHPQAFIDTIGEGAGVFSACEEERIKGKVWIRTYSCKFSESAENKTDITGQYEFMNMRAYLYWMVRDFLDPRNKMDACLAPNELLKEELTETRWKFMRDGVVFIEPKEDIKKRLKRSPDHADALANTFYPVRDVDPRPKKLSQIANMFH